MPHTGKIEIEDIRGNLDNDALLIRVDRDSQAAKSFVESRTEHLRIEAKKLWQGVHLVTPRAGRSKLFIRKPRAIIETIKAELIDIFFSGDEFAKLEASRPNIPEDEISTSLWQLWLNYRLDGKPIKWFQTIHSAIDDLGVDNIAVAHVDWKLEVEVLKYKERVPVINPENNQPLIGTDGQPLIEEEDKEFKQTIKDEPFVELVQPERMLLDPRINWINPYGQFLIHVDIMTYQELVAAAEIDRLIDLTAVDFASQDRYNNPVTIQRMSNITPAAFDDPDRAEIEVWKYWYLVGSKWWVAWTYRNAAVIRKPKANPNEHGKPPYVIGFLTPESHMGLTDSILNVNKDYFIALNGNRNQRYDNVALILNKHAIVSEDANVDMASLLNRRAGGVTTAHGDIRKAIVWDEVPEISASAYNEETILERNLDEATGLPEPRKGLTPAQDELATQSLLKDEAANKKGSVNARVMTESFITPIIEMLIALGRQHETDEKVMHIVGARMGLEEKNDLIPSLFQIEGQFFVKVNAGVGSVSKDLRLRQTDAAISRLTKLFGPFAALPLLREYLALLGITNINQTIETIKSILVAQASEPTDGDMKGANKEDGESDKMNGKQGMPTQRSGGEERAGATVG